MPRIPTSLLALFALAVVGVVRPPAGAGQQADASLTVAEAVVTTGVQDREPVDDISSVPADVGQVYLWTRITGAEGEVGVAHVWYHRDQERARVSLRVASPDWRTWTSKQIQPGWTGSWRVEVVGPDDEVLETVSFQVEESGAVR